MWFICSGQSISNVIMALFKKEYCENSWAKAYNITTTFMENIEWIIETNEPFLMFFPFFGPL